MEDMAGNTKLLRDPQSTERVKHIYSCIKIESSSESEKTDLGINNRDPHGQSAFIKGDEKTLEDDFTSFECKINILKQDPENDANFESNETLKLKGNYEDDLTCGQEENFSSSDDFENHKDHKNERKYLCPKCDKTFKQLNHLKMHERVHAAKHSVQCKICSMTFKKKANLKNHLKKHYKEKDISCDVCSASFYTNYELKIHAMKHTGECPHECLVCGDRFSLPSRLKRHMNTHTTERPFQCEVCGTLFRERYSLHNHMGVHLPRGPYPCDICGEEFSRLNALTLHRKVHNTDGTYFYIPKSVAQKRDIDDHTMCKSIDQESNNYSKESDPRVNPSLREIDLEINETDFPEDENTFSIESDPKASFPLREIHAEINETDCCENESCAAKSEQLQSCISNTNNLKGSQGDCVGSSEVDKSNIPHPSVVQEALTSGTVLESQAENGKGYLIVLPKSLVERNYTLYTVSPTSVAVRSQHTENIPFSKENREKSETSCNFICDNSLDSVPGISLQSEETINDVAANKSKKQKKLKNPSDDKEKLQAKKIERPVKRKVKTKNTSFSRLHHCQHCEKAYKSTSSLNIHMRTHTGERPYSCDFCCQGFKQLAHLQSHVRLHTGENPYQCKLCSAAFNQSSRLRYHIQTVHVKGKRKIRVAKELSVRNFYCKICDKTFINSCFKTDHMKTHADDVKYGRDKNRSSPVKSETGMHLHPHSRGEMEEGEMCEFCGFQCENVKDLQLHKKLNHENSEDTSEISKTSKKVSQTTQRNSRKMVSLPRKQEDAKTKLAVANIKALDNGKYECILCSKVFSTMSNSRVHMRMHNDRRPYKCNECGRAFRQISHLKDHYRMHTGEKPFRCSVCNAAFSQSSGVKVHIKKHHQGQADIINTKSENDARQDSITFETLPHSQDKTVIISVESDNTVSVKRN